MRTRLIRIGNSRGIRIPKALIESACLDVSLRMRIVDTGLLIERIEDDPKAGWAEAARQLAGRYEGGLLDDPTPTGFDESEWECG
ncbi:MAG: AbrB/MazE/SpoVT family DNA-binding domain-containing protein [Gemmatimonadota bacterium]|nr:AbrB/MazE/SpoVT family DNA-binding domain-containing protein [Gemmatimonadota bacterium]